MLKLRAPAKINLSLDVLHRRPDGYHEVDMIMQTLDLADEIILTAAPNLQLECDHPAIPVDSRNLAWKAAQLLQERTGTYLGVKINIKKNIPIAAGLAGGSSDAAAVLIGLNSYWNLGLAIEDLLQIGLKIGADVPFCILQGTMRARGIGELLTRIQTRMHSEVLLVTPDQPVPTAFIYQRFQAAEVKRRPKTEQLIQLLDANISSGLEKLWGNVLEEIAAREFPVVRKAKHYFDHYGLPNLMSGSGPSIFALNPPPDTAKALLAALPPGWFGCLTHF